VLSPLHEILVELLRRSPGLLRHYLGDRLPPLGRKRLRFDTDHTRASRIVEVGNDLVLKVRDHRGKLLCALIVEVQLARKQAKARTWALYAAWAHYRLRCPVHVVVLAVDPAVAKWAAGPFCIGDMTLHPWVIGPEHMRPITSVTEARRSVEMTFLSGMAHRDSPVAEDIGRVLHRVLDSSEHEHAGILWDIFITSVDEAARRALEMELGDWVPKSDWGRKVFAEGKAKGMREGKAEGRREGEAKGMRKGRMEGKAEGEAQALLLLLQTRRVRLTALQQRRIRSCREVRRLRTWIRRAATAATAAEVFGAG
jgi:hypothetical protein